MVDWKRLVDKATEVVQKRGGPKSLEEDAGELADIAKGGGTLTEKAKAATKAIQEPGAPDRTSTAHTDQPSSPPQGGRG